MSIKPILFNADMVRAILDGRKTQTRRVIKNIPLTEPYATVDEDGLWVSDENGEWYRAEAFSNIHPGDILYVRETWAVSRRILLNVDPDSGARHWSSWSEDNPKRYLYRAGYTLMDDPGPVRWRPSIHMPKEAARIWLKVTNVRAERLRSITAKDAIAEGCPIDVCDLCTATDWFCMIWDDIADESTNWNANPWVWVITFERINKPEGWPNV